MKSGAVSIVLTCLLFLGPVNAFAQTWVVKDNNLRNAIRSELGIHDRALAETDALLLVTLRAVGANIQSLEGLEKAENLQKLVVGANRIDNLSPIAGLSQLKEFHAWNCGITRLDALADLVELEALQLGANQIGNIDTLKALKKLKWLDLSYNHIDDISALSRLRKLKWLDLRRNEISDISALRHLSNVEKLWIAANDISDIAPISHMTRLEWLMISGNWISDVGVLEALPNLKLIYAHDNLIELEHDSQFSQLFDRLRAKNIIIYSEPQNLYAIHEKLPLDLPE